jgi:hypothetical protein
LSRQCLCRVPSPCRQLHVADDRAVHRRQCRWPARRVSWRGRPRKGAWSSSQVICLFSVEQRSCCCSFTLFCPICLQRSKKGRLTTFQSNSALNRHCTTQMHWISKNPVGKPALSPKTKAARLLEQAERKRVRERACVSSVSCCKRVSSLLAVPTRLAWRSVRWTAAISPQRRRMKTKKKPAPTRPRRRPTSPTALRTPLMTKKSWQQSYRLLWCWHPCVLSYLFPGT